MIFPIQTLTRLLIEDMEGKPNYCCFSASKFISLPKSTMSELYAVTERQTHMECKLLFLYSSPSSPMVGNHPNIFHPNIFFLSQDVLKLDGNKGLPFSYQKMC